MEIINSFKKYLLTTVPKLVIKDNILAEQHETMESRKAGDLFVTASLKIDTFQSHSGFSARVLRLAGITDINDIKMMSKNKELIPHELRNKVIEANRAEIIRTYEEGNDYYRMLNGLPFIEQDPIMVPIQLLIDAYSFDPEDISDDALPLHTLPQPYLNAMEADGYIETLKTMYPDHEYLSYIGIRKIDIVVARRAEHYALLYVPRLDQAYRFYRDFIFYYEESRDYFLNVVYNYSYRNFYEHYDGFIGFMILHMTIQRMISSLFKVMVDRDFYDLETVRVFLDSYGVPFVELFTMNQQKMLVKNLNILLRKKASVQVFYDILNLLGYTNFELLKYMLVKQHHMIQENDESLPKPEFVYRTFIDEDGNAQIELDKANMYDYYFVGIEMNETDIRLVDKIDATAIPYDEMTVPDPTWIEDNDLVQALEDIDQNYIETKYAKIRLYLRAQEIMFEEVYLGRLLLDRKKDTSKIFIDAQLIISEKINLFQIEILLICLIAKRTGMKPKLLDTASQILYVLGFDFSKDLDKIKQDILNHPKLLDSEIAKYLVNVIPRDSQDINTMYRNIKGLNTFLEKAMQETNDPDVYHAYKKLYRALLIEEYNTTMYNKNGVTPTTYTEILKNENSVLYEWFINIASESECIDYINYITTKLTTLLEDTEYLSYLNPVDTNVIEGLLAILRTFKSFTIDIKGIETLYVFDSRLHNMIKMMDKGWLHAHLITGDTFGRYNDASYLFDGTIGPIKEKRMLLIDGRHLNVFLNPKESFHFIDNIQCIHVNTCVHDNFHLIYSDSINSIHSDAMTSDKMRMNDRKGLQFKWKA